MKSSVPLIRELRSLFGFIRGLTIVLLVLSPISIVVDHFNPLQRSRKEYGPVEFVPDMPAFRVGSAMPGKALDEIKLRSLTGSVSVSERGDGANLVAATLVPVYAARLTGYLTLAIIAHFLWRLCQAVEQGEIFSKRNSRLVQWLGVALVARPFVSLGFETWRRESIARHLVAHIQFENLRPVVTSGEHWWEQAFINVASYGDFDFTLFITGLLVLALAEVFRRGLALKEESDLTV